MSTSVRKQIGRPALELIEEAVHLLRGAPLGVHLCYHMGTAPFVLALLWFWSDMTRGAFADRRCAQSALGLAILYLWMKAWQSVFAARLAARVRAEPEAAWGARRWLRILVTQAAIQPWGLLAFPLSLAALAVPLPWCIAYFQCASVAGDAAEGSAGACMRRAWRATIRWPGQNHAVFGLMLAVTLGVLVNLAVALGSLPFLAKMLLGLDNQFALSVGALLNSTFVFGVLALAYLVLDPLAKTVYVVRTFESESIHNAADLRARLRFHQAARAASTVALLFIAFVAIPVATRADAPPAPPLSVKPPELEKALRVVLDRPDFTWRAPREQSPEEEDTRSEGRFRSWLRARAKAIGAFLETHVGRAFEALGRLLQKLFSNRSTPNLPTGKDQVDWITGLRALVVVVIVVGVGWICWMLYRLWGKRAPTVQAEAPEVRNLPDLTQEHVSADQLPEDDWIAMARELAGRGEFRLALRAVYLASLAHLARRELVRLAPFKTNREYRRELERRSRGTPLIPAEFGATAADFDRVWYGEHPGSEGLIADAESRLESIRRTGP